MTGPMDDRTRSVLALRKLADRIERGDEPRAADVNHALSSVPADNFVDDSHTLFYLITKNRKDHQ